MPLILTKDNSLVSSVDAQIVLPKKLMISKEKKIHEFVNAHLKKSAASGCRSFAITAGSDAAESFGNELMPVMLSARRAASDFIMNYKAPVEDDYLVYLVVTAPVSYYYSQFDSALGTSATSHFAENVPSSGHYSFFFHSEPEFEDDDSEFLADDEEFDADLAPIASDSSSRRPDRKHRKPRVRNEYAADTGYTASSTAPATPRPKTSSAGKMTSPADDMPITLPPGFRERRRRSSSASDTDVITGASASIARAPMAPAAKPERKRTEYPAPQAVAEAAVQLMPQYDSPASRPFSLEDRLKNLDESFSEALLHIIDEKGMTDAQVYKTANIDRRHFGKIRNNPDYKPTKNTVLALAIALKLTHEEAEALLNKAGFAFSRSSITDTIVEYYILSGIYDIFRINDTLFEYDQSLLVTL